MAEEIFPNDIIFNILSRPSVKSLQRFKCVSKSWKLLITDPPFIRLHLEQNKHVNAIAAGIYYSGHSCFPNLSLDYCPLEYVVTDGLYIWGSCHGLLCVARYNRIDSSIYTLYLWNPSTREYKTISLPPKGKNPDTFPMFGFGYSSTSMDYEIVQIVRFYDGGGDTNRHSVVYVYSVKNNVWQRIQDIAYFIQSEKPGALVHGKLHWKANSYATSNDCIISLDLGNAEFNEVPLPVPKEDTLTMDFTTLDGKLCAFGRYREHLEIWEMNVYGVKESWTMLLQCEASYPSPTISLEPLCCVNFGDAILMLANCSSLSLYDPRDMSMKSLRGDHARLIFKAMMYTPSLVQVGSISETEESCTRLRQPTECQENKRKRKDLEISSNTYVKRRNRK